VAQCPHCSVPLKDKQHVLQCPATSAMATWNKAMQELSTWLSDQGSDPLLWADLINALNAWCNNTPQDESKPWQGGQAKVAWDQLLDGWVVQQWQTVQANFGVRSKARNHANDGHWS